MLDLSTTLHTLAVHHGGNILWPKMSNWVAESMCIVWENPYESKGCFMLGIYGCQIHPQCMLLKGNDQMAMLHIKDLTCHRGCHSSLNTMWPLSGHAICLDTLWSGVGWHACPRRTSWRTNWRSIAKSNHEYHPPSYRAIHVGYCNL